MSEKIDYIYDEVKETRKEIKDIHKGIKELHSEITILKTEKKIGVAFLAIIISTIVSFLHDVLKDVIK